MRVFFRKQVSLIPGLLHLNVTDRGVSLTATPLPGVSLNIGRRGLTETVGVPPGSGIFAQWRQAWRKWW